MKCTVCGHYDRIDFPKIGNNYYCPKCNLIYNHTWNEVIRTSLNKPIVHISLDGKTKWAIYSGSNIPWIEIPLHITVKDLLGFWKPMFDITDKPKTKDIKVEIKSNSNPKLKYTVECFMNQWTCTCPGYMFRRMCKHIDEAKKSVEV